MDDEIQFDKFGNIKYHPNIHRKHGIPLTIEEQEYLCKYFEHDGKTSMSFALERTEKTLETKVGKLRKNGQFDYFKNLNLFW